LIYLLDTNALIYAFKNQGAYRQRLETHAPADLGISSLSLFELEYGLAQSTNPKPFRLFLDDLLRRHECLQFDADAAVKAGQIRASLRRLGQPIGPYDLLLAGAALSRGLILVTHNVREFERVPGLKLEDWFD
jgi:tRNA(fMet)-specific endonuclease VapC